MNTGRPITCLIIQVQCQPFEPPSNPTSPTCFRSCLSYPPMTRTQARYTDAGWTPSFFRQSQRSTVCVCVCVCVQSETLQGPRPPPVLHPVQHHDREQSPQACFDVPSSIRNVISTPSWFVVRRARPPASHFLKPFLAPSLISQSGIQMELILPFPFV